MLPGHPGDTFIPVIDVISRSDIEASRTRRRACYVERVTSLVTTSPSARFWRAVRVLADPRLEIPISEAPHGCRRACVCRERHRPELEQLDLEDRALGQSVGVDELTPGRSTISSRITRKRKDEPYNFFSKPGSSSPT